ncbi:MAG: beta-N-acetylglucosaminidase [Flavobacteriales bacterium]|nr:beta-N-acetylglucosaminidase [Flavobacteriales bacterium]
MFQFTSANDNSKIPYQTLEISNWADSLLGKLSIDQKIAQLFMVHANGKNLDESHYQLVDSLIVNYDIGGVIFFQSGPNELKKLLKRYNNLSDLPLLAGMDAEWGVSMRLDSVQKYPWMMSLGACLDDNLIYQFGKMVASEFKELGLHINFAPVVDINNNPKNPIIDRRSFGSDKQLVANKALAYMSALQDNNILACAKHFPGHGDTDTDSHYSLPILTHDRARLDSLELFPFSQLINNGLGSVMIAHMNLPEIDTLGIPSSFSRTLISDILKKDMQFQGLVVSDALNMNALSGYNQAGERELKAFLAGNDILLYPNDIGAAIELIKSKVLNDHNLQEQLDHSCKQILMIKKWVGLFDCKMKSNQRFDFISESSSQLNRDLSKHAVTVLKNQNSIIPISHDQVMSSVQNKNMTNKIACILMGPDSRRKNDSAGKTYSNSDVFYKRLNNYVPISKYIYDSDLNQLIKETPNPFDKNPPVNLTSLLDYDVVIVGLHYPDNNFWEKHRLSKQDMMFIEKISTRNNVILSVFGHPRLVNDIPLNNLDGLIVSYQNSFAFQDVTAQLIFGSMSAKGRLPLSLDAFASGSGLNTDKIRDLSFVLPIEVGVSADSLKRIDSLVHNAISQKVMPGCQIVIARHGKVFYNKSFGFHTYDAKFPVNDDHLYDIASITKIAAAAPIFIDLVDQKSINLNKKLKRYNYSFLGEIKDYKQSDKGNLKIIDILTHQAQLFPWIPFYKYTLDENKILIDSLYSKRYSLNYQWLVAQGLYLKTDYRNKIFQQILESELLEKKEYKYSDLGFYLLQPIVEDKIKPLSIDEYVRVKFYKNIEALRLIYNPLQYFHPSLIVATENDNYFRNQLIKGYVHDQGAALFGGVALHAGLFSNAIDMMKLMQLYLNNGRYVDRQILSEKNISRFTSAPFYTNENRRGIVFDKPSIDPDENGPTCDSISLESYGHSGWTGTLAWADPSEDIVYIFLSNARSFPDGKNTKLLDQNIRTEIQDLIYQSIIY